MKNTFYALLLLLTGVGCTSKTVTREQSLRFYRPIDRLLVHKDFFEARDRYNRDGHLMSEFHRLIAGARIDHVFNRLDASNEKIATLFEKYNADLSDSLHFELLTIEQINHGRKGEYGEAFHAVDRIISAYADYIPAGERADYLNARVIWKSLAGQPQQELAKKGITRLKIKRDKAGLSNLVVRKDADSLDFVFDTGANLSTVTASIAKRFNMIMMDSTIRVRAITGATVKSRMAVCPELHIGNMVIHNAVFLVFADSALAVPQLQYQINGIIGFPVIEAMREVQITQTGELIVPQKPSMSMQENMALDFLTPVIQLNGESYTFDTGANKTILYRHYFDKHRQYIESHYSQRDAQMGGAGGTASRKIYSVTFMPEIDGKKVSVDSVTVLQENMMEHSEDYYGNIGQDLIRKFGKMTINFESMFIRFD